MVISTFEVLFWHNVIANLTISFSILENIELVSAALAKKPHRVNVTHLVSNYVIHL